MLGTFVCINLFDPHEIATLERNCDPTSWMRKTEAKRMTHLARVTN